MSARCVHRGVRKRSPACHWTTYTDENQTHNTLHAAAGECHSAVAKHGPNRRENAVDVVSVIRAADIPGVNDCGPIVDDDPILVEGVVGMWANPCLLLRAQLKLPGGPPPWVASLSPARVIISNRLWLPSLLFCQPNT